MIQDIAVVLVSISAIIFVHELGHFLFMKLFRIKVERFSIGFPPRLFGVKLGGTDFCFGAIPAGGYVKPAGENYIQDVKEDDPEKDRYLVTQPAWKRILVFFAGPLFSFLLGAIIFSGLFYHIGGIAVSTNVIGAVVPNSPAEKAGLKRGDRIVEINGQKIKNWEEAALLISQNKQLNIKVTRGQKTIKLAVAPELVGAKYMIGIESDYVYKEIKTLPMAAGLGLKYSMNLATLQTKGLAQAAKGKVSKKELDGPLAIFKALAVAFREGWLPFLSLVAVMNIILAVMNLVPIPLLDGGQILIGVVEMITWRRLSKQVAINLQWYSLILIIFFSLWLMQNDISKLK